MQQNVLPYLGVFLIKNICKMSNKKQITSRMKFSGISKQMAISNVCWWASLQIYNKEMTVKTTRIFPLTSTFLKTLESRFIDLRKWQLLITRSKFYTKHLIEKLGYIYLLVILELLIVFIRIVKSCCFSIFKRCLYFLYQILTICDLAACCSPQNFFMAPSILWKSFPYENCGCNLKIPNTIKSKPQNKN